MWRGDDGVCCHKDIFKFKYFLIQPHHSFCVLFPPLGTTADRVEVEHYDPYSNTWALTCPALKYVTNFTATACHGKLYVIGSCAVKYNALAMQCYNPVIGKDEQISSSISKGSAFFRDRTICFLPIIPIISDREVSVDRPSLMTCNQSYGVLVMSRFVSVFNLRRFLQQILSFVPVSDETFFLTSL